MRQERLSRGSRRADQITAGQLWRVDAIAQTAGTTDRRYCWNPVRIMERTGSALSGAVRRPVLLGHNASDCYRPRDRDTHTRHSYLRKGGKNGHAGASTVTWRSLRV